MSEGNRSWGESNKLPAGARKGGQPPGWQCWKTRIQMGTEASGARQGSRWKVRKKYNGRRAWHPQRGGAAPKKPYCGGEPLAQHCRPAQPLGRVAVSRVLPSRRFAIVLRSRAVSQVFNAPSREGTRLWHGETAHARSRDSFAGAGLVRHDPAGRISPAPKRRPRPLLLSTVCSCEQWGCVAGSNAAETGCG